LLNQECISPEIERHRARGAIPRDEAGVRLELVEVFGDRERVPDLHAVVLEAGDEKRGREQQQLRPRGGSSLEVSFSAKSRPAILQSNQPRSDQDP
jgi:hypothetical protein